MINLRILLAVLALALAGGCGQSAGPAESAPSVAPVPAGCEPTPDRLTWSESSTTPMLTDATMYVNSTQGTILLDQPFIPSVVGVTAPKSWTAELAESLQRSAGVPVHVASPAPSPSSLGFGAPGGTTYVIYAGVERVTAEFEVRCSPPVAATFHGWSRAVQGVVFCAVGQDPEPDAYGRLALELCPEPAPAASSSTS